MVTDGGTSVRQNWNGRLRNWSLAIGQGKGQRVRKELAAVTLKELPREKIAEFSAICRRADRAEIGLRLLGPFVKAARRDPTAASPAELAEYAASLVRFGAGEEAISILRKIDPKEVPEALLYLSYALASGWDYASMIPVLTAFLEQHRPDPYSAAIARVNLAAAYTWQEPGPAVVRLLEPLIEEARVNAWQLLHGNALEILAQNAIARGDWAEAQSRLVQSRKLLRESGVRDVFFARKWKVFLQLRRYGWTSNLEKAMAELRSLAHRQGHWETLRQCELFGAIARKDDSLLEKLYFGTPFPAFQARVLMDWHRPIPQRYEWVLLEGESFPVLDLARGRCDGENVLTPGRAPHRALALLARDFYRPIRLASLALNLYPDEVYNPQTSPQRVHYVIAELRKHLKHGKVPLAVRGDDSGFRLLPTGPVRILITRARAFERWEDPLFENLRAAFGRRSFSTKEAHRQLGGSTRTVLRILTKGVERGELGKKGKLSTTCYCFLKGPSKK